MKTKEKIKAEITRLKSNFEDEYHPSEYLKKAYADEISKLENKLTRWDADNNVGTKTEESKMKEFESKRKVGKVTSADAQLREKLGNDVVDKVIDSLPNFEEEATPLDREKAVKLYIADKVFGRNPTDHQLDEVNEVCNHFFITGGCDYEWFHVEIEDKEFEFQVHPDNSVKIRWIRGEKSAPEGTGTHLKDALRDQRGRIESEFVVYGFCVLLFLGILISGLCGKYDAPQKETTPFKELVKTVQYTPKSKPSLNLEDFQANDVEHFVERVRCHNYYQRMVNNGMVSLDDAKYALDHGFECGNELKI